VAAREAARRGLRAYLVGGAVRDRLLGKKPKDLDIALEGDAEDFARAFARRLRARAVSSSEFGTAAVLLGGPKGLRRIDFSSTRGERYRHPAALPEVFPGTIGEDLARRDFSINAMAIALNGPEQGSLLDPFGGRADLEKGVVRLLHPASPSDDPTRAFRAVRIALRLGFRIDAVSRRWIGGSLSAGAFRRLSGDRLRREVLLLFQECEPASADLWLHRLELDRVVSDGFRTRRAPARGLRRVLACFPSGEPVCRDWASLEVWLESLPRDRREEAVRRLSISGERASEILSIENSLKALRAALPARVALSVAAFHCFRFSPEKIAAMGALLPAKLSSRLREARRRSRRIRLSIGGDDLKRHGIPAGPSLGRALAETWKARIDRRLSARRELAFALRRART
jgi:tRNA nucleotidyltransferase (CCA-adding enzyme)